MDAIWKTAIKATGAVGVVGLLFSILINKIFLQEMIAIFGSDRIFYIVIVLICIFGIAIITAIMQKNNAKGGSATVIYKDHSRHKGDNRF